MDFDEEESKQMMAGVSIIINDQSQSSTLIIDQSQVSMDSENSDNLWTSSSPASRSPPYHKRSQGVQVCKKSIFR